MSISCSLLSLSQEVDSRLLSRYSSQELSELVKENPEEYKFLVYALDNAVYMTDVPKGKSVDFQTIDIANKELNFLDLGLTIKNENQYFKVEGQDKLLVVKSRLVLNHENK